MPVPPVEVAWANLPQFNQLVFTYQSTVLPADSSLQVITRLFPGVTGRLSLTLVSLFYIAGAPPVYACHRGKL